MFKKLNLIFILSLVINSCITSRGLEIDQSKVSQSGWIENSFGMNENLELFFIKKNSTASSLAMEKKSGAMMQESCIANALDSVKPELISELSNNLDLKEINEPKQIDFIEASVSSVNVRECQPTAEMDEKIPFSEWGACECILYAKVNGGKESFLSKIKEF